MTLVEHEPSPISTTRSLAPRPADAALDGAPGRRHRILAIIVVAQLITVLDATVVIIALPSAQRALHISVADRQWVVTAYALAFAGLLLLGGRMADHVGAKRTFTLGLIGFAAASALGGLAQDQWMLFGSRALQGAMAAVMAPAALAMLTVTFTEPGERARAFGVYGAVAGGGSAIGMVLGGLLTEYTSWRWTLLINTPIAVATALAASSQLTETSRSGSADRPSRIGCASRARRRRCAAALAHLTYRTRSRPADRTGYDLTGAATVTAGLMALVYGFTRAETHGWGASSTMVLLAAGAALLAAFVAIELRSPHPLLPLRVVLDRNRGGSYLVMGLAALSMFAAFLFLTYYWQQTLHYSALETGLAFLPVTAGIAVAAGGVVGRLLPRLGARAMIVIGLLVSIGGFSWLTQIGVGTSYVTHLLVPELVVGFGLGLVFTAAGSTALLGVDEGDAGVASALLKSSEQVGSSLGIALLNTIAASVTARYLTAHGHSPASGAAGIVHGYTVGFAVAAGFLTLALLVTLGLIRDAGPPPTEPGEAESTARSIAAFGVEHA